MEAGLASWDRILARADAQGDSAAQVRAARMGIVQAQSDSRAAQSARRDFRLPKDLAGENMVTPAGRLLRALLQRIGLDELSEIGFVEERYYGNAFVQGERPLPSSDDLLDAYQRSQTVYAAMDLPSATPPRWLVLNADADTASLSIFDAQGRKIDGGWVDYRMQPVYGAEVDIESPAPP